MQKSVSQESVKTNDKIFEILFEKDDITWQTIIYELVKSGDIDPWDIDISLLTNKYINIVKKLEEFDFKVSGKVLLAAAILLKIKSNKLVGEDIEELDRIISGQSDEDFFEENLNLNMQQNSEQIQPLIPRVPQPRKRKVSIYDLMGALEKALEVKQRRLIKNTPSFDIEIPKKRPNINLVIQNLFLKIKRFFVVGNNDLTFSKLIPSESREDKVFTFIPLLHLAHRRKIDLEQKQHFGDIEIFLRAEKEAEKELSDLNEKPEK